MFSATKSGFLPALILLGVVAFPQLASANAGTPLMWASMLHLVFGNAFIGIGEGILLARLFAVSKWKSVAVMILANYFSAWIGCLFLNAVILHSLSINLTNGWQWFWVMVVVTFAMTLLLEWPFIAWCLRGTRDCLRRSVRATLVTQSASYVLVFGWYWMASGTSLYTEMHIVEPAELSLPASVLVYYIAPADGSVHQRTLTGNNDKKVCDLHSTHLNDRLLVRPNQTDKQRWDLLARLETNVHRDPRLVDVLTNLPVAAAPDRRITMDPPVYEGTWFSFGEAPPLGAATHRQWTFFTGFWPKEGVKATHTTTGQTVRFAYETPFAAWNVRNAVHLPTDKLLFQLGDDQICGFDPTTRRVALLWRGRGPVAVIPLPSSPPENK